MINNNYKTLPIGTIFTYNGNKYKVCKDNKNYYICPHCAFDGINCDNIRNIRGYCCKNNRTDNIGVYYEKINNEIMNKDNDTKENIITPIFNTNNSLSDIKIECPKGYIIDVEHSDLSKGIIKFKNKIINYYDDILSSINKKERTYIFSKVSAINKLMNIAAYYNNNCNVDWTNDEAKYFITYNYDIGKYVVNSKYNVKFNPIYFAHRQDANAVINNPNFRDILDAIYKD
jgi:hypothetical protein